MNVTTFWRVYAGKREYKLTEAQYNFMQRENMENGRTFFWFDDFSISLSHVTSMDKVTEVTRSLPEFPDITPEQIEQGKKTLAEIRNKAKNKFKFEKN